MATTPICNNGFPMTDERFKVAFGVYPGITPSLHFGSNPDVGTSFEIVREVGGTIAAGGFHAAAVIHQVTSSSTADDGDPAGTGARTVLIDGLDNDFDRQTETVTLDGQTPVNTANAYIRINEIAVTSVGTGETNAGDIYCVQTGGTFTNGVPDDLADVEVKIPIGFSAGETTVYTVPAGRTLYVHTVLVFMAAGKTVTFRGYVYNPTSGIRSVIYEAVGQDTEETIQRGTLIPIPEKTTVWMEAKVGAGTGAVSGVIDGWLVENG
jgi:hypothetical protein